MPTKLGSSNPFPKVILVEQGSTPSNPSSGEQKVYIRTSDHHLVRVNSSGTVTDIEGVSSGGGGGTVITGAVYLGIVNGRLTTESGVPVSTTDRTAQGTIYFTPYNGNQVAMYTGTSWIAVTFSEISLALSSLTSGKNYDVFLVYDGSPATLRLALSAAWSSDTARTDAIALQNGVPVKSGSPTYRHIGTIRTTGTSTTEDSGGVTGTTQVGGKRFVWNRYNQVQRSEKVVSLTDFWDYGTNTWRQAEAAAGNKNEWVTGESNEEIWAQVNAVMEVNNNSAVVADIGVGIDSTTAPSGLRGGSYSTGAGSTDYHTLVGTYVGTPGLGYHYAAWLEKGADGTRSRFHGDSGGAGVQSGAFVRLMN